MVDIGPSADALKNAKKLGIDLSGGDTVILNHGYYDHSGGIIPFSEINPKAAIYMQSLAAGDYYADDGKNAEGECFRYIGIDKNIASLPGIRMITGNHVIDDELELFTIKNRTHELQFTNKRLLVNKWGCRTKMI